MSTRTRPAAPLAVLFLTLSLARRLDYAWRLVRRAAGYEQKKGALEWIFVVSLAIAGTAFLIWFVAAKIGEGSLAPGADAYALGAYKMSPLWMLGAYGVLTAGELMLSPMGLSLVSKVAPIRMRGLMMGGWFVATGFGNKLTQIGQLWDDWLHSTFWLFCAGCAMAMAIILVVLLRPLKKAMPGV